MNIYSSEGREKLQVQMCEKKKDWRELNLGEVKKQNTEMKNTDKKKTCPQ